MIKFMHIFLRSDKGATAIEYGLIAALLIVTIVGAVQALGQNVFNVLWVPIVAAFSGP